MNGTDVVRPGQLPPAHYAARKALVRAVDAATRDVVAAARVWADWRNIDAPLAVVSADALAGAVAALRVAEQAEADGWAD